MQRPRGARRRALPGARRGCRRATAPRRNSVAPRGGRAGSGSCWSFAQCYGLAISPEEPAPSAPAQPGRRAMLQDLLPQAERIAAKLKARGETVSIAESSTAGMISAALLAIPGASAYFMGGAGGYTRQSRAALLEVTEQELAGITPPTANYALLVARE